MAADLSTIMLQELSDAVAEREAAAGEQREAVVRWASARRCLPAASAVANCHRCAIEAQSDRAAAITAWEATLAGRRDVAIAERDAAAAALREKAAADKATTITLRIQAELDRVQAALNAHCTTLRPAGSHAEAATAAAPAAAGSSGGKQCDHSGVTETPLWRRGPASMPCLCNACGTRHRRTGRVEYYGAAGASTARELCHDPQAEAAAAAAPAAAGSGGRQRCDQCGVMETSSRRKGPASTPCLCNARYTTRRRRTGRVESGAGASEAEQRGQAADRGRGHADGAAASERCAEADEAAVYEDLEDLEDLDQHLLQECGSKRSKLAPSMDDDDNSTGEKDNVTEGEPLEGHTVVQASLTAAAAAAVVPRRPRSCPPPRQRQRAGEDAVACRGGAVAIASRSGFAGGLAAADEEASAAAAALAHMMSCDAARRDAPAGPAPPPWAAGASGPRRAGTAPEAGCRSDEEDDEGDDKDNEPHVAVCGGSQQNGGPRCVDRKTAALRCSAPAGAAAPIQRAPRPLLRQQLVLEAGGTHGCFGATPEASWPGGGISEHALRYAAFEAPAWCGQGQPAPARFCRLVARPPAASSGPLHPKRGVPTR